MTNKIRFAGAQIPVTNDVQLNLIEIKKAIDWASENNVEYLVTPEASLSGYSHNWYTDTDELPNALAEVERYASFKNVGLCIGTLWNEIEFNGRIRRNQIRFYKNTGEFLGIVNKNITIEQDESAKIIRDPISRLVGLRSNNKVILVGGLICVDMYYVNNYEYVPKTLYEQGARLFVHCTNGVRNIDPQNNLSNQEADVIGNDWHDIHFRRLSFLTRTPIITVDNCYMADGTEYHGSTSSESGVIVDGKWVTKVPRSGTQYFYHDFSIEDMGINLETQETEIK